MLQPGHASLAVPLADQPQDVAEPLVRGIDQGRQQQSRHTQADSRAVVAGSVTDHQRLRGRDTQLFEGQSEDRRVRLLYPMLEGQHKGIHQLAQSLMGEGRTDVEVDVTEYADLDTTTLQSGQRVARVGREGVASVI